MHDTMSMVQQVINDARKLATRLTEHDSTVDSLLAKTQVVFKLVECKKEYCEEMNELNEAANGRQRSALIKSIQEENRNIRELQRENKELRLALEEHQNVTELIMSKYRDQVTKLMNSQEASFAPRYEDHHYTITDDTGKTKEMSMVLRRAVELQEKETNQQRDVITALIIENKGLREMLHIATKSGSLFISDQADADTQTEIDESDDDTSNKEDNLEESKDS